MNTNVDLEPVSGLYAYEKFGRRYFTWYSSVLQRCGAGWYDYVSAMSDDAHLLAKNDSLPENAVSWAPMKCNNSMYQRYQDRVASMDAKHREEISNTLKG